MPSTLQSSFINTPSLGSTSSDYTGSPYQSWIDKYNAPSASIATPQATGLQATETPFYKDGNALAGYAGLAGSLLQAAALPGQMKLAKLQRQGLEQNLAQAKTDSAFQANVRDNLKNHRMGA